MKRKVSLSLLSIYIRAIISQNSFCLLSKHVSSYQSCYNCFVKDCESKRLTPLISKAYKYTLFRLTTLDSWFDIVKKCQAIRKCQEISKQEFSRCTQTDSTVKGKTINELISEQNSRFIDSTDFLTCTTLSQNNLKSSEGNCIKVKAL